MIKNKIQSGSTIFIGQWHGLLPLMFHQYSIATKGLGIELSTDWSDISNRVNSDWDWQSISANAEAVDFMKINFAFDTIVNTSCEHMSDSWLTTVPDNTLIIAQSTNYQIAEHINCVNSIQEFEKKLNLSSIKMSEQHKFNAYTRFTVIGTK